MTGSPTQGIKTVLHPVSDLAAAKAVYTALLGVPPQNDESYYVGYEAAGQHIGLVPGAGQQGMTSPVAYWHVPDIEAKLADVSAAGATVREPRATSAAAAWWPPSPTPTATSPGCSRTGERRPHPGPATRDGAADQVDRGLLPRPRRPGGTGRTARVWPDRAGGC
jgi:predicted enzyme related to lactoylglutathione lyase